MLLTKRKIKTERLYDDGDITDYINLYIRTKLGGYKVEEASGSEYSFLLEQDFNDSINGNNYIVAITPPIDTQQLASPIATYLNKTLQPTPEGPDNRKDVFDELMPLLLTKDIAYIKILFPYNISQVHWLTGEILIYKNGNTYTLEIYAHDPYGAGQMTEENFALIISTMAKIQHFVPDATITFDQNSNKVSPYQARQSTDDGVSCGVIVAKDIIERIEGRSLTRVGGVYPVGAEDLRKEQIELFVSELSTEHKTRINFLTRNTVLEALSGKNYPSIMLSSTKADVKDNCNIFDKEKLKQNYFKFLQENPDKKLELKNNTFESKKIEIINNIKSTILNDIESRFKKFLSAEEYGNIQKYRSEYIIEKGKSYHSLSISNAVIEKIAKALQAEFLYNIGKEFIETEKRSDFLKKLGFSKDKEGEEIRKDSELLEIMKLAIHYAKSFTEESKIFLGAIGACSHELISRKSFYIRDHSGIPWRAMSYIHRVLSEDVRETKLLPGASFTEGIYYDDQLYKEGITRIIHIDLVELYASLESILTKNLYYQVFPIANNILSLYHFYYNECHLQFLRYASDALLKRVSFSTNVFEDNLSNNKINLQGYFLYIINIGEAFNGMSYNIIQYFNPKIVKAFKDARNVLAHPERKKDKQKVEELFLGKKTLYTFLDIEENDFNEEIELIHDLAIQLLQKEYNYKFNVRMDEISFFPVGEDIEVDPYQLPKQAHRIITAYENMPRGLDGTFERFALAYELRPIGDILKTDYIIEEFITAVVSSSRTKIDINYRACILFLQYYSASFNDLSIKPSQDLSENDKCFLKDYELVLLTTGDYLININDNIDKMKYQLLFLITFTSEDNTKIKDYFSKINDKLLGNLKTVSIFTVEDCREEIFLVQTYIDHFSESKEAKNLLKNFNNQSQKIKENIERIEEYSFEDDDLFDHNEEAVDETQVHKIQKEAELSYTIIDNIDLAYKEFSIAFKYYQNFLETKLEPFAETFLGPTVWYHNILMGSLSRYLLEKIDLISNSDQPKFKIFFKAYFQIPRGDIAHNQVPLIGDQDYIRSLKSQRDARAEGRLVMTGPESIALQGIQKDNNGDYYIESRPWKHFPAGRLEVDSILHHQHIESTCRQLLFMSKIGKTIYCYHTIVRDKVGKISLDVYLCDKETDFPDLKSNRFALLKFDSPVDEYFDHTDLSFSKTKDFREVMKKTIDYLMTELRSVTVVFPVIYFDDQLSNNMQETKASWSKVESGKRELMMSHKLIHMEAPSVIRFNNEVDEHEVRQRSSSLPAIHIHEVKFRNQEHIVHAGSTNVYDARETNIKYWFNYNELALRSLLDSRLRSEISDKELSTIYILETIKLNQFVQVKLVSLSEEIFKIFSAIHEIKTILLPILVPKSITVKHWVGIVLEKNGNEISITYLDSENQPVFESIEKQLVAQLQQVFPGMHILFNQPALEPQRYTNCGLELIENFVYFLSGERVDQEISPYTHSELYVQNLILEYYEQSFRRTEAAKDWLVEVRVIRDIIGSDIYSTSDNNHLSDLIITYQSENSYEYEAWFSLLASINNLDSIWQFKKWLYSKDIAKFYQIMQKYNIARSVDELQDTETSSYSFSIDLENKELESDVLFVAALKEKLNLPIWTKEIEYLKPLVYKANIGLKVTDTMVDITRLLYMPTIDNAKKTLMDIAHIYSMYTGINSYSALITSYDVLYKFSQGEYTQAFSQAATSMSYAFLPTMIASFGMPYISFGYITGLTIYTGYHAVLNARSFYYEFNQKDFTLSSNIAYQALAETLSTTALQNLYDFASEAKEYEKAVYKIKLEEKGEFGQKLYEYIYSPIIEEKYELKSKVIQGILTQGEAEGLKAKHIKVSNYDHCMEVIEQKEEEADHYYCFNEEQEILDHIIIIGEAHIEKISSL